MRLRIAYFASLLRAQLSENSDSIPVNIGVWLSPCSCEPAPNNSVPIGSCRAVLRRDILKLLLCSLHRRGERNNCNFCEQARFLQSGHTAVCSAQNQPKAIGPIPLVTVSDLAFIQRKHHRADVDAAVKAEADRFLWPLPPPTGYEARKFTEAELEDMPMQPIPIEEVIAKIHAPKKAGGKKKKKKKKKKSSAEDEFPRPPLGSMVWLRKRPLKKEPVIPPQYTMFRMSGENERDRGGHEVLHETMNFSSVTPHDH